MKYTECSDLELTTLLIEGDQSAYTEIYHRYKSSLYIFALRRVGNREEAKDIIHEIFLMLWSKCREVKVTTSLAGYLFASTRNRVLDVIARKEVANRYLESFHQYLDTSDEDTDHLIRYKELAILIEKEISQLPPKMREVFELSRHTHYSRKEIAEKLGLSEQTVKSHMHHALKILKSKLGKTFFVIFF